MNIYYIASYLFVNLWHIELYDFEFGVQLPRVLGIAFL